MADETPTPTTTTPVRPRRLQLRSVHTTSLPALLEQIGRSLAVTTYQAGKLILVRADEGKANTHFRNFPQPMGMALKGPRLAIGSLTRIWEYVNQPAVAPESRTTPKNTTPVSSRDRLTSPATSRFTKWRIVGDELWIVNTRFSCLATVDPDSSFAPALAAQVHLQATHSKIAAT